MKAETQQSLINREIGGGEEFTSFFNPSLSSFCPFTQPRATGTGNVSGGSGEGSAKMYSSGELTVFGARALLVITSNNTCLIYLEKQETFKGCVNHSN